MMTTRKAVLTVLGSVLFASAGYADDKKPEGGVSRDVEKQFQALDRNGDGSISKDELTAHKALAERFSQADKDGDGKLDKSEYQALEANASPDRSLGSVAPQESRSGSAGASARPDSSK
jgi:hypothetical protein